jgi:hypothetical protein
MTIGRAAEPARAAGAVVWCRAGRSRPTDPTGAPGRCAVPALASSAMKVEVLYFDGCPNHEALLPHLRALLLAAGADVAIELVCVEDTDAAERERFLGSPTVRVDGEDVEPGADKRTNFGIKCRLYATPEGLRGTPADEWVLAALGRRVAA